MNDYKVPAGWRWAKVGQVLEATQYGLNLLASSDGNTPIVGMKDLTDGRVSGANLSRVSISEVDAARYLLREGDILLNRTNSPDLVGKIGYVEGSLHAVFASYLVRLKSNRSLIDPKFLAFWLSSPQGQEEIRPLATRGVSQANINPTAFCRRVPVPLPPLSEQRRIADILATWDRAIDTCEAMAAAKSKQARWLRWDIATGAIKSTTWRKFQLREILVEHGLLSTGEEEVFSVSVHRGLVNQVEHLGRSFSASKTHHYNRVLSGDIVYTKSPTGDFPYGIVKHNSNPQSVIVSPLYGVFTPLIHSIGTILDFLFESPEFAQNYLAPLIQKGAKNTINITNKRFLEGSALLPTEAVAQENLAAVIKTVQAERLHINQLTDALRRERDALASELLTGRLRVGEAARLAVAAG